MRDNNQILCALRSFQEKGIDVKLIDSVYRNKGSQVGSAMMGIKEQEKQKLSLMIPIGKGCPSPHMYDCPLKDIHFYIYRNTTAQDIHDCIEDMYEYLDSRKEFCRETNIFQFLKGEDIKKEDFDPPKETYNGEPSFKLHKML